MSSFQETQDFKKIVAYGWIDGAVCLLFALLYNNSLEAVEQAQNDLVNKSIFHFNNPGKKKLKKNVDICKF